LIELEVLADVTGFTYDFPRLVRLAMPFKFAMPSLVYLFFCALLVPNFRWNRSLWPHAIPFALSWVLYLSHWTWFRPDEYVREDFILLARYVRTALFVGVALPYLVKIRFLLVSASQQLKNEQSDLSQLHLEWLNVFMFMAYFAIVVSILDLLTGVGVSLWKWEPLTSFIGIFALTFSALKTSALFHVQQPVEPVVQFSDDELYELKKLLDARLRVERLFLKPGLKLSDLALAMGKKPYIVSQVIKQGLATNFYELVNQLRVEEAKQRLASQDENKILAIAMDCGFNSKSTFNDIFRRTVGMTPSEYKRSNRDESRPD